jgi:hypothetical protein
MSYNVSALCDAFPISFLKFLTFVIHDNMISPTGKNPVEKKEKEVFRNGSKPERLFNR